MASTYVAYLPVASMAPGKNILGIFNNDATKIVKIRKASIIAFNNGLHEFYQTNVELRKSSAVTGGRDIDVSKMDSNNDDLDADIYVRTAGVWTDTSVIKRKPISLLPPAVGSAIWPVMGEIHPVLAVLWDAGYKSQYQPLILNEDEGFRIIHFGSVMMGELDAEIIFTVE